MTDRQNAAPVPADWPAPDYADDSLAFAYTWIRRKDGRDAAFGVRLLQGMASELEAYAAARGARLTGQPGFDFPSPFTLPRHVQRGVRLAMFEWRPWRWPGLVLVRIWQDTTPLAGASTP